MPFRKTPLVNDHFYHIFSRGVNHAPIFIQNRDYERFLELMDYYRFADHPLKFSFYQNLAREKRQSIKINLKEGFITIIAFVLMPNHFHFVLRQKKEGGITSFINYLLTSYTKFFNAKYKRTGPLFEGRFKAILVETEEQILHLVRYLHLNPYSSAVVKNLTEVSKYPWSSLAEYLNQKSSPRKICEEKQIILSYFASKEKLKNFTFDQAEHQKKLEEIKHLIKE